jgi:hypothetical protein
MNIRKVPAQNGIDWLRRAVNVGGRNPRAVFGAAALFFLTLYAVAAVAVLPVASRLQGRSTLSLGESLAAGIPLLVALAIATPLLLGGLMHVIHEVERGGAARARDLFATLRQGRARSLMGLGFVQVALNVAGVLLVVLAAGPDYVLDSIRVVQGAMEGKVLEPREQPNVALLMLLQLVNLLLNYLSVALMLLCVPLIVLSRTSFAESLRVGLRASWLNLAPNLLGGIVFAIAVLVAAVMVTLVSAVVGGIGAIVHPVLGGALALAIWLAFAVVMLVVAVAASYFAWQDMFDTATPPAAPAAMAHIEA